MIQTYMLENILVWCMHCIGPWPNSQLSISEIMSIKLTFDYWSLRLDSHVTYMHKQIHMVALQRFLELNTYAEFFFVVVMSCKCVKIKSKSLQCHQLQRKLPFESLKSWDSYYTLNFLQLPIFLSSFSCPIAGGTY